VRVPGRTAHVEIKGLDPTLPVIALPNGPWKRRLPDGTERSGDGNYGRQALAGTFALADSLRLLARSGEVVAPAGGDFKRCVDTVLCVWEVIPSGSSIEPPRHVTVLGYQALLERLLAADGGQCCPGTTTTGRDSPVTSASTNRSLNLEQKISGGSALRQ
jgi:hypothetical protein